MNSWSLVQVGATSKTDRDGLALRCKRFGTQAVTSFRPDRRCQALVWPGLLLSLGAGYGEGGRTAIDGVTRDTKQKNWRFQVLFTYPIARNQGISVAVASGVTQQAGPDFDAASLGYQYAWGGR